MQIKINKILIKHFRNVIKALKILRKRDNRIRR